MPSERGRSLEVALRGYYKASFLTGYHTPQQKHRNLKFAAYRGRLLVYYHKPRDRTGTEHVLVRSLSD